MNPHRPACLVFALLLVWPTVLPTSSLTAAGDETTATHPASCTCPKDACRCDHDATLASCATHDAGWSGCGLQRSPCGPDSPRALARYSLSLYEPPAPLQLAPPPPRDDGVSDAFPVAHSVTLGNIEPPPEPHA